MSTEAELARGLLLQRRGREGRGRVAASLLAIDAQHRERSLGGILQRALHLAGLGAAVFDQLARELLFRMLQFSVDRPIFPCDESSNFILAFADHAERRALHAAGRQSRTNFFPQQRAQIEADQEVEGAPRLLGVNQVHG